MLLEQRFPYARSKRVLGQANRWGLTATYGFAHLGKSLFWYSSEILFAYFLTDLAGLATGEMGIVLASGFLVSAAIDIAVGYGMRQALTSASAAGRMQLAGSVLCSIALFAVFLGAWMPVEWRFAYAIVAGIGFRIAYAAYDIPQNALMALATADRASRLRIASTRIWCSGAATLIVASAVGPIIAMRDSAQGPAFLLALTAVFALVAVASAARLAATLYLQSPVHVDTETVEDPEGSPRVFVLLILLIVATSACTQAFSKLEPYFATYALRSAWWGGAVIILMAVGIVVGQPVWLRLCKRHSKTSLLLLGAAIQLVALAIFWLTGAASPPIAAAAALVFGLGNGAVGMAQWAAFSDAAARLSPARSGPSYGMFAAGAKVGLAGGGLLLSSLLGLQPLSAAAANYIVLLMAVIPATGAVLVMAIALMLRRSAFLSRETG